MGYVVLKYGFIYNIFMKIPKKTKYRKYHKNKIKVIAKKTSVLRFGSFGLKALESGRITAQHIETVRQTIGRKIRPKGQIWIRSFPHLSVTSKPSEYVWVRVKVMLSFGSATSKKVKFYTKFQA
jgi:large subunit ribosomal protein L16